MKNATKLSLIVTIISMAIILLSSPSMAQTPELTVEFSSDAFNSDEGADSTTNPSTVALLISGDSTGSGTRTLTLNVTGGTASNGTDFNTSGTIIIQEGVYDGVTPLVIPQLSLEIVGDAIVENNEIINLEIVAGTNTILGDLNTDGIQATTTYTITNDDSATISINSPSVTEGTGGSTTLDFTLSYSARIDAAFTLDYATADGTLNPAIAGSDYTAENVTGYSAAINGTSDTISIAINPDSVIESNETFTVTISNASETNPIGTGTISVSTTDFVGIGTINNDEASVTVEDQSDTEGDSPSSPTTLTFVVTLNGDVNGGVNIGYTTAPGGSNPATEGGGGSDYTDSTGTLAFSGTDGETRNISVNLRADTNAEPYETFVVSFTSSSVAFVDRTDTAIGTIENDDAVTISIGNASAIAEGDSGTTNMTFTVTAQYPVNAAQSIGYSVGGTANDADFGGGVVPSGSVTLLAGQSTVDIDIPIAGDLLIEGNETVQVTITADGTLVDLASTPMTGTGTITNDDILLAELSASTASALEGNNGTNAQTDLKLVVGGAISTSATTMSINLANNTTESTDYSQTIAAIPVPLGDYTTPVEIDIPVEAFGIVGDFLIEGDEIVVISLGTAGANIQAGDANGNSTIITSSDFTITDDDKLIVSLSAATASLNENDGTSGQTVLTLKVSGADTTGAASASSIDISLAGSGTNPADGSDYTQSNATVTIPKDDYTTEQTINIPSTALSISGDTTPEADETLTVELITPVNVEVGTPSSAVLTITNDDAIPVNIAATSANKAEGSSGGTTNYTFTVTTQGNLPVSGNQTLDYAVSGAVTGLDIVGGVLPNGSTTSSTVTINNGASSAVITIPIVADSRVENNESFTVTISNPSSSLITLGTATANGTIRNDDSATISIGSPSIAEDDSGGVLSFPITTTNPVDVAFSLTFTTAGGSAVSPDDFTIPSDTSFTYTPGGTNTIDIPIVSDTVVENDEQFTVTLDNGSLSPTTVGSTGTLGFATTVGTGTIINDDASFRINNVSAAETGSTTQFRFTVTRDGDTSGPATINYETATTGTATSDDDYTAVTNGVLNFSDGDAEGFIDIDILGDAVVEPNETFFVNLTGTSVGFISDNQGQGTIRNDDSATISIGSPSADEDSGTLSFPVTTSNPVDVTFDLTFTVAGTTATSTSDFTIPADTSFTYTPGGSNTIDIDISSDTRVEDDEQFTVTLDANSVSPTTVGSQTNALTLSATPFGTGTIQNDDTATISIGTPSAIAEGTGNGNTILRFPITTSPQVDVSFTITYSTNVGTASEEDYTAVTNQDFIYNLSTNATFIDISVTRDNFVEDDEQFTVDISGPTSSTVGSQANALSLNVTQGTGTIQNDDSATISIGAVSANEDTGTLSFPITTSARVDVPFDLVFTTTVDSAISPDDFTAFTNEPFTYERGVTTTIDIPIATDSIVETNEQFDVTISGLDPLDVGSQSGALSLSATTTNTGTILNDDNATITVNDVSDQNEDDGVFEFTITLSNEVDADVSVNYATSDGTAEAVADSDYTAIGSTPWTFSSGETTKLVTVNVATDEKVEADETFNFVVSNLVSDLSSNISITKETGIGTINNDDQTTVSINPAETAEGDTGEFPTVTFSVTSTNPVDGGFTINYATGGGTATANTDYVSASSFITFADNSTTAIPLTFDITIIGDDIVEANEIFNVNLSLNNASIVDAADIQIASPGIGTINNDDSATLTIDNQSVTEANTTMTFTVTLNGDVQDDFNVNYLTGDNTATAPDDYKAVTLTPLTFTAGGSKTQTIGIDIYGDNKVEPDGFFGVVLLSTTNPAVTIGKAIGVGQIVNDDRAAVTIQSNSIAEGDTDSVDLVFTATLNNDVEGGLEVAYNTVDGSATTADSDYTAEAGSIIFVGAANETQTISVSVTGDTKVETDEIFGFSLTGIAQDSVSAIYTDDITATASVIGSITNDDSATITIGNVTVEEGDTDTTDITFTATLDNAVQGGFTVFYSTKDGTAIANVDYIPIPLGTSLVWTGFAGENYDITVTIYNNLLIEPDKTFTLSVDSISASSIAISNQISALAGTATISNNDGSSLRISSNEITEGDDGTAQVTLDLTIDKAITGGFKVDYATSDGSATEGSDYTGTTGTVTFDGLENEVQQITLEVIGDLLVEGNETFNVTLSNVRDTSDQPIPEVSIATEVGVVTINDDDSASLRIDDITQDEGDSGAVFYTFTVTLDTNVTGGFIVDYATADVTATAGRDYIAATGTLSFNGTIDETQEINVTVYGDPITEQTETFNVALSNITNDGVDITDIGVGTITNDDSVTLSVSDAQRIEGNTGTSNLRFTVTLNDTVEGGFDVDYATEDDTATTADSDYANTTGTLTFVGTSGEQQTITVPVTGDFKVESNETLTLTLSNPSNAGVDVSQAIATGTITNDDSTSVIIADASITEGNTGTSNLTITATLNEAVEGGFTVNYATSDGTATAGSDYTSASGTLTFNGTAGENQTFDVIVLGDTLPEGDETFTVSLSSVSNANVTISDTAIGTILNDEAALSSNGSFETAGTNQKLALDWAYKGPSIKADRRRCNVDKDGDGIKETVFAAEGECAYRFYANPKFISFNDERKIKQRLDNTGVTAGDTISFSALVKANNFTGKAKIVVKAVYTPITDVQSMVLIMDQGDYDYKLVTSSMVLTKTPPKLLVVIKVKKQRQGAIWFDDIKVTHIVNTAPVAYRGDLAPLELPPPPSNFRN